MLPFLIILISCTLIGNIKSTDIHANGVTCPENCDCYAMTVNCKGRNLTSIPEDIPISTKILYLGFNYLTSIGDKAFEKLSNLTELYLNNNHICKVTDGAFHGLSSLKILSFTTNKLTSLSAKVLEDVSHLKELFLTNNDLDEIPNFASVPMKELVQLNLNDNKLRNANLCKSYASNVFENLENLDLGNNANISKITLSDLICVNQKKFTKLNLSRCKLRLVSPGALKFEQLKSINLAYCEGFNWNILKTIFDSINSSKSLASMDLSGIFNTIDIKLNRSTFDSFPKSTLRYLLLQHSKGVFEIESGTFRNFPMLETLDFSQSDIADFKDTLENCTKLKRLVFSKNQALKESSISQLKLPNLQTLIVSDCMIERLSSVMFDGITNLVNLTVKGCKIHQVVKDSFMKLHNLATLDLSNNNIGGNNFPVSLFSDCPYLEYINLSNNKMTTIFSEYNLFKNLHNLKYLNLSKNLCTNLVSSLFKDQKNLTVLDLSENKLGQWFSNDSSSTLFDSLSFLEKLDLHNNEMPFVTKKLFEHLPRLQSIDLAQNKFSSLSNLTFSSSNSLKVIDLSDNTFSTVNVPMLLKLPASASIDLKGNPFDCSCDLREFRSWINTLNVSTAEKKLINLKFYKCSSPNQLSGFPVLSFDPHSILAFCNWVYILIGCIIVLAFILVTIFYFIFKYRWVIRFKWYILKRRCFRRQVDDEESQHLLNTNYDLLISYMENEKDKNWVTNVLVRKLGEFGPNFRRIFTYDEMDLGLNELKAIPDAIYGSAKILICLSEDYLDDSRRCDFEVPLCIRSRIDNEYDLKGRNGILIILLDPHIDPTRIPKGLRILMGNGGDDRCLEWYENDEDRQELFWNDLKEKLT